MRVEARAAVLALGFVTATLPEGGDIVTEALSATGCSGDFVSSLVDDG
jgi:hypothetical protein